MNTTFVNSTPAPISWRATADVRWTRYPVFLHRRFRHGFIFINTAKGIKEPTDLIGRRVGGTNFQPAGSIWARGILEEYFGVPHTEADLDHGARRGHRVHAAAGT